jgi:hypothetical protein
MENNTVSRVCIILSLCLCLVAAFHSASAQSPGTQQKEATVQLHAAGTFEVKGIPQPPDSALADSGISRVLIDKQFHGGLEAASKGQMLAFGDPSKGSAGYVAIERVTGSLGGRSGSFALQHTGTMDRGALQLSVHVVPGSGTGQLAGLAGSMNIQIEAGKHSYTFDYTLPAAP